MNQWKKLAIEILNEKSQNIVITTAYRPPKEIKRLFIGAPSGLRKFLATESPLKMMKNAFYFTSKTLFVLKIFKFLS